MKEDELFKWADKARTRRRGECNSCCVKKERARRLKKIADCPEQWFNERQAIQIWYKYKLTVTDLKQIIEDQGGVCPVCKNPVLFGDKDYAVDHDHKCCAGRTSCGKCVRGVLHHRCNMLLGHAEDSPERLRSAAKFLEEWNDRQGAN